MRRLYEIRTVRGVVVGELRRPPVGSCDEVAKLLHDVAQPISSVASLSELLATDWAELPEEVRRELALRIEKNAQRLVAAFAEFAPLLARATQGSEASGRR